MKKKLLITDDAAFMRMLIKKSLEKEGYEIEEACDGKDMLEKYEQFMPNIVTLDITMPNMDGIEALKKLMLRYPEAKVVMCSAMGQRVLVQEAIKLGACDFIIKPFVSENLLETIRKHII